MKSIFVTVYIVTALLLIALIYELKAYKKTSYNMLANALIAAFVANLSHIFILAVGSYSISLYSYAVFFGSIDFILFYFLLFVKRMLHINVSHPVLHWAARLAIMADLISLFFNCFNDFGHYEFNVVSTALSDQTIYYVPDTYFIYDLHLVLSYIFVAYSVILLVHEAVKAPRIYRIKYIAILIGLIAIVAWDAVYVYFIDTINMSITGYAVVGLITYYMAAKFIPRETTSQLLSLITENMQDMLIFFDAGEFCSFCNNSAREFFHLEDCEFSEIRAQVETQLGIHLDLTRDDSYDVSVTRAHRNLTLTVTISTLKDSNDVYLGRTVTILNKTQIYKQIADEQYKANHDSLTNIYNADCFYRKCKELLANHPGETFYMIASDVKDFKMINDVLGKEQGDIILRRIADLLVNLTRNDEVYGRISGDRFALLMPKKYFRESIFLRNSSDMLHFDSAISYLVTVYFGIYEIEDQSMPVTLMYDRAMMAVNSIKGSSNNRIAFYTGSMRDNVLRSQELTSQLDRALKNNEFELYLQPQITPNRECPGAEVLVRWNHPMEGLLFPGSFIPIFEQNGMIAKVDYYTWEHTCMLLKEWKSKGIDMYLSVNISPKDFLFFNIYDIFVGLVEKYNISPNRLRLEITESAIINNLDEQLILINKLQDYGFLIEMDDFGSGYSSLNTLKDIPVDVLKVDMLFLQDTKHAERSRKIIKAVLCLAKDLNLPVITEGVENEEQLSFLNEYGCDFYQGYYFEKPIPIEKFERKYFFQ